MPLISRITIEEAAATRTPREATGKRAARVAEFNGYVDAILEDPSTAVTFREDPADLDGTPVDSKFVLSLRNALKRRGVVNAVVRKSRADKRSIRPAMVRAWISAEPLEKREPRGFALNRANRVAAKAASGEASAPAGKRKAHAA